MKFRTPDRKHAATQSGRNASLHDLGISRQFEPTNAEQYMQSATALRATIEQEDIVALRCRRGIPLLPAQSPVRTPHRS